MNSNKTNAHDKKKKQLDNEIEAKLLRVLCNADSVQITNSNNIHDQMHSFIFNSTTTITTTAIACDAHARAVNK